jgi:glycosyltransferase involved in cell wall biosynthesis
MCRSGMSNVQVADVRGQKDTIRWPKLLFLSHPFPPLRAISCVRTWNIAKYLTRLGWDVTVVTPRPSEWRNIDDASEFSVLLEKEGIRRILTEHRWRFLDPDTLNSCNRGLTRVFGAVCRRIALWLQVESTAIGWIKAAESACASLTCNDVDVILATGSPFCSFGLAKRLADRLGRPYVVDYRDPWTENPHASSPPRQKIIREEKRLLASCAAGTVVSPSWAESLARRFGIGLKLHVVTNGYDPEQLTTVRPHVFEHPAIVYTGGFYHPKRVITPIMAALKRINHETNRDERKWYFHYYGGDEEYVRNEARKFGVQERLVTHGIVSRAEALSAVRGAAVTVVITSVFAEDSQKDKGIVPGKLFEPLGLGTPILLIAPSGSDATQIVEETGMGRAFDGTDIEGIVQFLSSIAQTEPNKRSACADRYAWPVLAAKLDRILRGVIAPRQGDMLTKTKSSIGHKKQVLS